VVLHEPQSLCVPVVGRRIRVNRYDSRQGYRSSSSGMIQGSLTYWDILLKYYCTIIGVAVQRLCTNPLTAHLHLTEYDTVVESVQPEKQTPPPAACSPSSIRGERQGFEFIPTPRFGTCYEHIVISAHPSAPEGFDARPEI
jgi:hypothetical protein